MGKRQKRDDPPLEKKRKKARKVTVHVHLHMGGSTLEDLMESVQASMPAERSHIHDCRIDGEWRQIQSDPTVLPQGVVVEPVSHATEEGKTQWRATVECTNSESPNHGKVFEARIVFPGLYPFRPPQVSIVLPTPGPLDHENIHADGRAVTYSMQCCRTTDASWNPVVLVAGVLAEIQTFL